MIDLSMDYDSLVPLESTLHALKVKNQRITEFAISFSDRVSFHSFRIS